MLQYCKAKSRNIIRTVKKKILGSHFSKLEGLLFYIKFSTRRFTFNKQNKIALLWVASIHPPAIRLHQLFHHFLYCGYTCHYDISFSNYMKLRRYGKKATLINGIYPYNKKVKNYSIIISDDQKYLENADNEALKIFLNFHILEHLNTISSSDFFYPLVHHFKYNSPAIETKVLSNALTSKRKIGAFFAGNVNVDTYNSNLTRELFNVNTRHEMFNCIISKLPKNILYIPNSLDSFLKDVELGFLENKIVLLDINNFEIPKEYYFKILLQTNFFIHMCGVTYPYCHNQIESMMAGCIPVTQFSDFFIPPFQHEINSLLFKTLDELIDILLKLNVCNYNNMIQAMRENTVDYYMTHYSFRSFENKLSHIIANHLNYTNYYITTGANNIIQRLLPK